MVEYHARGKSHGRGSFVVARLPFTPLFFFFSLFVSGSMRRSGRSCSWIGRSSVLILEESGGVVRAAPCPNRRTPNLGGVNTTPEITGDKIIY